MATDTVGIWNQAISRLGISTEIQTTAEDTAEANACRRFFEQCRDEMLEEYPWPFAKVTVALQLVTTAPTTEWGYAYGYPSNCLSLRRILGAARNETRQTRVPYLLGRHAVTGAPLIYTDWPNAVAEYTQAITDTTAFSPLFVQALSYKLAMNIGPRLMAGDPFNLVAKAEQRYRVAMTTTATSDANEEQPEVAPESEFIRAREGGLTNTASWNDLPGPFP